MESPELVIDVLIDACYTVESGDNGANMITFHGSLDHPAFKGDIMPGGVDTQRKRGDEFTLSARYIIKGKDASGKDASIFIENNGTAGPDGELTTVPTVLTDCEALKYLETAELYGKIKPVGENHIQILIFKK